MEISPGPVKQKRCHRRSQLLYPKASVEWIVRTNLLILSLQMLHGSPVGLRFSHQLILGCNKQTPPPPPPPPPPGLLASWVTEHDETWVPLGASALKVVNSGRNHHFKIMDQANGPKLLLGLSKFLVHVGPKGSQRAFEIAIPSTWAPETQILTKGFAVGAWCGPSWQNR